MIKMKKVLLISVLIICAFTAALAQKTIPSKMPPVQNFNEKVSDYYLLVDQHDLRPYCNVEFLDDSVASPADFYLNTHKGTLSSKGNVTIESHAIPPYPAFYFSTSQMNFGTAEISRGSNKQINTLIHKLNFKFSFSNQKNVSQIQCFLDGTRKKNVTPIKSYSKVTGADSNQKKLYCVELMYLGRHLKVNFFNTIDNGR
jgi:hypothetical protein